MTQGTGIGQSRADGQIDIDVADAVAFIASLALRLSELPLEQLPPSPNRAKRIAADDVDRGVRCQHITAPSSDLICERLVDTCAGRVGGLRVVNHLCMQG